VVEPVLEDNGLEALLLFKKVSNDADRLVVGSSLDSLSEEVGDEEVSEDAEDGVLDVEGSGVLDWEGEDGGGGGGMVGCLGLLIGSGNPREMLSIPRQNPLASLSSQVEVKMHSRSIVQSSE